MCGEGEESGGEGFTQPSTQRLKEGVRRVGGEGGGRTGVPEANDTGQEREPESDCPSVRDYRDSPLSYWWPGVGCHVSGCILGWRSAKPLTGLYITVASWPLLYSPVIAKQLEVQDRDT